MNDYNYHQIIDRFKKGKVIINYMTAGYPTVTDTIPILLKLQNLGTDIIEIGVPFTDPIADGPIIQKANKVALNNGVTIGVIFEMLKQARKCGLQIPVVLMGYYNTFYQYGLEKLMESSVNCGVNGFIIVDLSPDLANRYCQLTNKYQLALIPLISMLSSQERIKTLANYANCFIYCIAVTGVTGSRTTLDTRLPDLINKIRQITNLPLGVGFGISTTSHAEAVWKIADAIIMGTSIIKNIATNSLEPFLTPFNDLKIKYSEDQIIWKNISSGEIEEGLNMEVSDKIVITEDKPNFINPLLTKTTNQYLPEILVTAHQQLNQQFKSIVATTQFQEEFNELLQNYVGRPSPLYLATNLSDDLGGANIWFKREDLNHTGSHKINNAIGQALLAKKMGKTKIIAETGAGQHGVATATACCLIGLECTIYMGAKDVKRQAQNVEKIRLLGAELITVTEGTQTLRDAINRALMDWLEQLDTCHYLIGSAIGAEPYPEMVAYFQSIIGKEAKQQFLSQSSKLPNALPNTLPDYVIACVGGGSNAIGIFNEFINDSEVKLIGVEAGGNGQKMTSASINKGSIGILHGTKTYLLQDKNGQILDTHSISAGLDYPGIGPHHRYLHEIKRVEYVEILDYEAVEAFQLVIRKEGIIPALESSHAIAYAIKLAKKEKGKEKINILVNLSGRGEKDINTVGKYKFNVI